MYELRETVVINHYNYNYRIFYLFMEVSITRLPYTFPAFRTASAKLIFMIVISKVFFSENGHLISCLHFSCEFRHWSLIRWGRWCAIWENLKLWCCTHDSIRKAPLWRANFCYFGLWMFIISGLRRHLAVINLLINEF